MKKLLLIALFFFIIVLAACGNSDDADAGESGDSGEGGSWEPEESIEIVAPAGAGGGWDTTARMVAKVLGEEGMIEENIGVVNKTGGGGAVGWSYIANYEGDPHKLFVASPPIILIPLNGQSEYGHEDFTPLSNLIADYGAFAVREDAEWDDLNDLFEDMKEDPESVTVVGESAPGSMDHIQFVQIAKAAGVDITKIRYVSAQDGESLTQLLNGSVDVYSTGMAETVEQVKADNIKVLGITAPERLEGEVIEDFPTAIEQGIDETFVNWRGFFGPPGMDEASIAYYEDKFKELSDSEAFAEIRDQFGWDEEYMGHEEYKAFLDEQKEQVQVLLDDLGLNNE
ncbi:tricarboxylic transport TctC [Oceanobacillus oncorhynchi subsp. incaldanensis]|uniref:Tripartite tricarboxylate transporter family receptor n=2 Tax=Oceanobacillus TaxID=182709 RepID=A0A0A1MU34_9BACI|nr:tripartite tricarboxylate transporter substrate binding protein [Oceanobacillus oncorhynchi]MDM8100196.1 tripartite tricarboxylate transporter substrate binding protein [Oceanobacillus oncorhynchi]UUI40985.1 tripartite tricarboxylate transporter substrate binding protein [Oceanobacillus oncorhynchi]GIO19895.1 tricarboxylic transport TctC [Oceanobacillus oncorhynchi subsp. incaldanensis]CEI82431.1 Tripartite tricarboxylate transporter family receptor [Oceanobacillus oncorhynchi]